MQILFDQLVNFVPHPLLYRHGRHSVFWTGISRWICLVRRMLDLPVNHARSQKDSLKMIRLDALCKVGPFDYNLVGVWMFITPPHILAYSHHPHTVICLLHHHLSFLAWLLVRCNTTPKKDSPSCTNQKLIDVWL